MRRTGSGVERMSRQWRFRRERVSIHAVIETYRVKTRKRCVVREISLSGALIELASDCGPLANAFELRLPHHDVRGCEIVWRKGQMVAVRFTGRATAR